jgi:hypothetical protein
MTSAEPFDKGPEAVTSQCEDALLTPPDAPTRHQLRLDRQARVGILRNLKEPPRLPPRKAALTGKWLDLRSRRRLRRQGVELTATDAATDMPSPHRPDTSHGINAPDAGGAAAGFIPRASEAAAPMTASEVPPVRAWDGRRFLAGILAGLVLAGLFAVLAGWLAAPPG